MSKSNELHQSKKEFAHKEHIAAADAHFAKKAKKKALNKAKKVNDAKVKDLFGKLPSASKRFKQ